MLRNLGYMTSSHTNNFILLRMIRTFFMASIISSVVLQVNEMVDGIIVGNYISSDAVSVIGLVMPFINIMLFFSAIIYNGSSYVAAKAFGAKNYTKMIRQFLICLVLATAISVLMACLTSLFIQDIVAQLTQDRHLQQLLTDYLPIMLWVCVAISIQFSVTNFLKMLGRPRVVTMVFVLQMLLNITLDLILVRTMGIRGTAIATLVSVLCSGVILMPIVFLSKEMRYVPSKFTDYVCDAKEAITTGAVASLTLLLNSLQALFVVEIVQAAQGTNGLFVISVYNQIMMVAWLVLAGGTDILYQIGGFYHGLGDMKGYRMLFREIFRIVFWGLSVVIFAVICYPQILGTLFGADPILTEWLCWPVRTIVFQLMGLGLGYTLIVNYNVLERRKMVLVLNLAMPVLAVGGTYLGYLYNRAYVWIGYTVGFGLFLFLCIIISKIISMRNNDLHGLSLIPKEDRNPSLSESLSYRDSDIGLLKQRVKTFLDDSSGCKQICEVIDIVCAKGKRGYWDFYLQKIEGHIFVLIKCIHTVNQEELPVALQCDINKRNGVTHIGFEL